MPNTPRDLAIIMIELNQKCIENIRVKYEHIRPMPPGAVAAIDKHRQAIEELMNDME